MRRQPERTCIGCRRVFVKNEVVRILAGPDGPLIDYREKLPGRAAYLCPRRECIQKGMVKDTLAKALHAKISPVNTEFFIARLAAAIRQRIGSLISVCLKAGKSAAGYSAVDDALKKGRIRLLLFARDISQGTRDKVVLPDVASIIRETDFTRAEFGSIFNRDLVGVVGILDEGFADALDRELQRLKGLLNNSN